MLQVPMDVHLGPLLKASRRKPLVGAGGSEVFHRGGSEGVVMFGDLADKHGEQPGLLLIGENDAVAFVFIEDFQHRRDVGCILPAGERANRHFDLARPEKVFRIVGETDPSLCLRLQSGNVLTHAPSIGGKATSHGFVQLLFERSEHVME